ncbi:MAG: sigma-70 family RNA polymerase sigma factor [Clostridia bacterium]|nr:sigma-70 family RNA polymerase sigma factor [Clostridia bacterium]
MSDEEIIALFWARDERAVQESERRFGAYCRTVAMNVLHNSEDAEECVNDTWLKAWRSIPPQRPGSLSAFLGRLTRNTAIDRLRTDTRLRRSRDLTVALDELGDSIPCPDDTDAGLLTDLVTGFLRAQSELDRKLFVGRYWYAHSLDELGRAYGLTVNAVNLRLRRTRERLRAYLTERGYTV